MEPFHLTLPSPIHIQARRESKRRRIQRSFQTQEPFFSLALQTQLGISSARACGVLTLVPTNLASHSLLARVREEWLIQA